VRHHRTSSTGLGTGHQTLPQVHLHVPPGQSHQRALRRLRRQRTCEDTTAPSQESWAIKGKKGRNKAFAICVSIACDMEGVWALLRCN